MKKKKEILGIDCVWAGVFKNYFKIIFTPEIDLLNGK